MKNISRAWTILLLFCLNGNAFSQAPANQDSAEISKKMKWFKDAKLGIFIHWGIYAVNGIAESWSFHNGQISHEDYLKQLEGFTAANYDPDEWGGLIKESGARYAVITSKHHDGVALWNSKFSNLSVPLRTPAKRDVLTPFVHSLREMGLKVGMYFSLIDWSHPNYPAFIKGQERYQSDSLRWKEFLADCHGQIGELSNSFNPDLFWFDGDWEHNAAEWNARGIREMILEKNKGAIINSRLSGYGDYDTPEQGAPVIRPKSQYWELCLTINDSWGYQHNDRNFKNPNEVIRIFADVISKGGNLLLDIGPRADGSIPEEEKAVLKALGRWIKKHSQAVYGTLSGLPPEHYNGYSTLSADKTMLYLFVEGNPGGRVMVRGLKNEIRTAWVVGNGTYLNTKTYSKVWWSQYPGITFIELPEEVLDQDITVIAVRLDGPVSLYREDGSVINHY